MSNIQRRTCPECRNILPKVKYSFLATLFGTLAFEIVLWLSAGLFAAFASMAGFSSPFTVGIIVVVSGLFGYFIFGKSNKFPKCQHRFSYYDTFKKI